MKTTKNNDKSIPLIIKKPLDIVVVHKPSRLSCAIQIGAPKEFWELKQNNKEFASELEITHENNQASLEFVEKHLKQRGLLYTLKGRSELNKEDLINKLVITVGGDGTLLDTSHYAGSSPILGLNSDPSHSVGALCIADTSNFAQILDEIISEKALLSPISRMSLSINNVELDTFALNDILFCHKNPASLSRYYLAHKQISNEQRSSGVWVATAAGSSGAIFSSGGLLQNLSTEELQFFIREPYIVNAKNDLLLLKGFIKNNESLEIICNMTEAVIYVDGPHKSFDIALGQTLSIKLAKEPLMLINSHKLQEKRLALTENRLKYRKLLF